MNRPGGEGGVVDKVEQLLRITDGHQALHRQAEAHGLVLGRFIHWTGREGNRLLMGGGGASQKHKDQTITTHMHMFGSMRLARSLAPTAAPVLLLWWGGRTRLEGLQAQKYIPSPRWTAASWGLQRVLQRDRLRGPSWRLAAKVCFF